MAIRAMSKDIKGCKEIHSKETGEPEGDMGSAGIGPRFEKIAGGAGETAH